VLAALFQQICFPENQAGPTSLYCGCLHTRSWPRYPIFWLLADWCYWWLLLHSTSFHTSSVRQSRKTSTQTPRTPSEGSARSLGRTERYKRALPCIMCKCQLPMQQRSRLRSSAGCSSRYASSVAARIPFRRRGAESATEAR
jgi:hypothetical protein